MTNHWEEFKHGRFVDEVDIKVCRGMNHNPPSMLVVPQGKVYIHKCPDCGNTITLRSSYDYSLYEYTLKREGT